MRRYIIKLDGKYLEWSAVIDAPLTDGLSLDKFKEYYKDEYGNFGMSELPSRLERVEENGISAFGHANADHIISGNRAGPNKSKLSKSQIIKAFCRKEKIKHGGNYWIHDFGWKMVSELVQGG